MAQQPPEDDTTASGDMPWGISYLREDIQGIRQDIRVLHARVDHAVESLPKRIDSRFALLLTVVMANTGVTVGSIIAFVQYTRP